MRILPSVVGVVLMVTALNEPAGGFSQTGDAAARSEPAKQQSPADAAFEPIQRDLSNLHKSLMNKGGIAPEDHEVIKALRERAVAFSREYPSDVRGPKAELLLSKWLKDNEHAEQLIRRILTMEPGNDAIRMALARTMRSENRYAEALDVIKQNPPDPVKSPSDAWLYADCLFAEHQFEAASEVYQAIPVDSIESAQRGDLVSIKDAAKEYVTLWEEEQDLRRSEEQADNLPRVLVVTSRGPITLELFENQAPNTVANFISLVEQGFYNTSKFHRVIANFMAQGGDPNSKPGGTGVPGQGNPGYLIPDEIDRPDHRKHFTGSLAMAKTDAPNTGGCQFYITVLPTPHLNGKHTVFGRVIEGLDVARSLKQDDEIKAMTVLRKRDHEYKPNTLPLNQPVAAPFPTTPSPGAETPPPAEPPVVPPPTPPTTPPATEPPSTGNPQ